MELQVCLVGYIIFKNWVHGKWTNPPILWRDLRHVTACKLSVCEESVVLYPKFTLFHAIFEVSFFPPVKHFWYSKVLLCAQHTEFQKEWSKWSNLSLSFCINRSWPIPQSSAENLCETEFLNFPLMYPWISELVVFRSSAQNLIWTVPVLHYPSLTVRLSYLTLSLCCQTQLKPSSSQGSPVDSPASVYPTFNWSTSNVLKSKWNKT